MTRIKICGITNMEDAQAAVECGAHALGFVFAPSPRQITPEAAADIMCRLPPFVTAVAVVVDEPLKTLRQKLETSGCQAVQLHGDETPDYIIQLGPKQGAESRRWHIVKAIRVSEAKDVERVSAYVGADAFLLDSRVPGKAGGTGVTFDWGLARAAVTSDEIEIDGAAAKINPDRKPIILAGGLDPRNVGAVLAAVRPYGVDVSSGVEAAPGKKDYRLMREFVRAVREFDATQG